MASYTAGELERETGFDRRTIAYYVQEGLLPKVGRRGPRTRYPKLVLDRLLFIRRVRDAEAAGELEPVSLSEIREMFERIPADWVAQVAEQRRPVTLAIAAAAKPVQRSARARRAALEARWSGESEDSLTLEAEAESIPVAVPELEAAQAVEARPASVRMPRLPADFDEAALSNALTTLDRRARRRGREPHAHDRWSRVEISPDIALSVRGVSDEDAPLLDAVRKRLRALLGSCRDNAD